MNIVFFLYEGFAALDVAGPYEVLSKLPGFRVVFAAKEKGVYRDRNGLALEASVSIAETKAAEVLLVPGGFGIDEAMKDAEVLDWVRALDATTRWTAAVCSGTLLLAAAGILDGRKCTTHWKDRKDQLRAYPVEVVDERYVRDGKYVTSAGVSAGIDMAIYLASLIAGDRTAMMIQAGIEYDPRPPFDVRDIIGAK